MKTTAKRIVTTVTPISTMKLQKWDPKIQSANLLEAYNYLYTTNWHVPGTSGVLRLLNLLRF